MKGRCVVAGFAGLACVVLVPTMLGAQTAATKRDVRSVQLDPSNYCIAEQGRFAPLMLQQIAAKRVK